MSLPSTVLAVIEALAPPARALTEKVAASATAPARAGAEETRTMVVSTRDRRLGAEVATTDTSPVALILLSTIWAVTGRSMRLSARVAAAVTSAVPGVTAVPPETASSEERSVALTSTAPLVAICESAMDAATSPARTLMATLAAARCTVSPSAVAVTEPALTLAPVIEADTVLAAFCVTMPNRSEVIALSTRPVFVAETVRAPPAVAEAEVAPPAREALVLRLRVTPTPSRLKAWTIADGLLVSVIAMATVTSSRPVTDKSPVETRWAPSLAAARVTLTPVRVSEPPELALPVKVKVVAVRAPRVTFDPLTVVEGPLTSTVALEPKPCARVGVTGRPLASVELVVCAVSETSPVAVIEPCTSTADERFPSPEAGSLASDARKSTESAVTEPAEVTAMSSARIVSRMPLRSRALEMVTESRPAPPRIVNEVVGRAKDESVKVPLVDLRRRLPAVPGSSSRTASSSPAPRSYTAAAADPVLPTVAKAAAGTNGVVAAIVWIAGAAGSSTSATGSSTGAGVSTAVVVGSFAGAGSSVGVAGAVSAARVGSGAVAAGSSIGAAGPCAVASAVVVAVASVVLASAAEVSAAVVVAALASAVSVVLVVASRCSANGLPSRVPSGRVWSGVCPGSTTLVPGRSSPPMSSPGAVFTSSSPTM